MARILIVLGLISLAALRVAAQSADVQAERVSMDMQLLRAIDGTRNMGTMAVWPQTISTLQEQALDTANSFGSYVRGYYSPLLPITLPTNTATFADDHNGRFRLFWYTDSVARIQADASLFVRPGYASNDGSADAFLLVRPSVRAMGSMGGALGYFLDLSNGMRIAGDPTLIAQADPSIARTLKFNVEDSAFFDRYIGYVQYQSDWMRVRFGREAMQFGFSPIDNYVHSIDAPLMDGILIDVPYKSVRFTMTHSAANGTDTSGAPVPSKYIATHRLAFDPVDWLSVAVSDMIVYWGRGLDLTYLNPLAFFVSAGLSTEERNVNDNSMLGFDVAVRPLAGTMLYGNIIIDDLNYGTLSDTSVGGIQNKFAYQIGFAQAFGNAGSSSRWLLSAEYARINPFTFSHRSINASYTTMDAPIGYNMQPNSDRIAAQLRHWITPRTFIRIDADYTRHGENFLDANGKIVEGEDPRFPGSGLIAPVGNVGGDILRGDGDALTGNAFLRGVVSYQRRIRLWFSAEWMPNVFTDVRAGYTNRNGGNYPTDFFFGTIELRIGY